MTEKCQKNAEQMTEQLQKNDTTMTGKI